MMKLNELLQAAGIKPPGTGAGREVHAVACDSRRVRPGTLFVALRGQNLDGLNFVHDAVERGAVAVLVPETVKVTGGVPVVTVPDTRAAYAETSAVLHDHPSRKLKVCGVTGTNGKTTVAFMVRDILRQAGIMPGMIGTVQYEIGTRVIPALRTTPDAGEMQQLLDHMVQTGCRSAVLEVSSHAVDQKRIGSVAFDVGVFTNLTQDHLDYHGTMEDYYQAKRMFFTQLGRHGKPSVAVINRDDAWGRRLIRDGGLQADLLTYGLHPEADVQATEVATELEGTRIKVRSPWGAHGLRTRLLGNYNVSNALAAFAAGGAMGIDPVDMAVALWELDAVPGRLEEVRSKRDFRVFVDYAHTDDALTNVLKTLRPLARGRLIVVFGCGGNRDRGKRKAMGEAVAKHSDLAVVTSDNPRKEDPETIIRDILTGFSGPRRPQVAIDRREAIHKALAGARKDDVVLIAGKGHETFQEFAHTVVPFDDRDVARAWLHGKSAAGKESPAVQ